MNFCPKCGSLLKIKKEKNKKYFSCACGYTNRDMGEVIIKEEVKKEEKDLDVVDTEDEPLPTTEHECVKCGHNEAYYWLIQMRAGDEAESRFYKCVKCKHTVREDS